MSKVIISVDTKTNVVECDIDGEKVSGAKHVFISSFRNFEGEDEVSLSIELDNGKVGEDGDLRSFTRVATASDSQALAAVENEKGQFSEDKTLIVHEVSDVNLEPLLGRKNKKKSKTRV